MRRRGRYGDIQQSATASSASAGIRFYVRPRPTRSAGCPRYRRSYLPASNMIPSFWFALVAFALPQYSTPPPSESACPFSRRPGSRFLLLVSFLKNLLSFYRTPSRIQKIRAALASPLPHLCLCRRLLESCSISGASECWQTKLNPPEWHKVEAR